jgi:hypothetical protein
MLFIAIPVLIVVGILIYRILRKRYIRNYNEMFEEQYPRRRIQRLVDRLDVVVKYDTKDIQLFEKSCKDIEKYETYQK